VVGQVAIIDETASFHVCWLSRYSYHKTHSSPPLRSKSCESIAKITSFAGEIHVNPGRHSQWIGLRENLQENPIFHGKIYGFL
jgi:hypothetical protein